MNVTATRNSLASLLTALTWEYLGRDGQQISDLRLQQRLPMDHRFLLRGSMLVEAAVAISADLQEACHHLHHDEENATIHRREPDSYSTHSYE